MGYGRLPIPDVSFHVKRALQSVPLVSACLPVPLPNGKWSDFSDQCLWEEQWGSFHIHHFPLGRSGSPMACSLLLRNWRCLSPLAPRSGDPVCYCLFFPLGKLATEHQFSPLPGSKSYLVSEASLSSLACDQVGKSANSGVEVYPAYLVKRSKAIWPTSISNEDAILSLICLCCAFFISF